MRHLIILNLKKFLDDLSDNEKVKITSFFYNDNSVYKLETHIEKRVNQVDNESKLIITEERHLGKRCH